MMGGSRGRHAPARSRLTIQQAARTPASTTTTRTPRTSKAHGSRRSTVRWTWCTPSGSSRRRSPRADQPVRVRSEEHTSELQSHSDLVCRLLLEKKKKKKTTTIRNHDDQHS